MLDQVLLQQYKAEHRIPQKLSKVLKLESGKCGEQALLFILFLQQSPELPAEIKNNIHFRGLESPDDHNFVQIGLGPNSVIIDPWFKFKKLNHRPLTETNLKLFNKKLPDTDIPFHYQQHGIVLYPAEYLIFLKENSDDKFIMKNSPHNFRFKKIPLTSKEAHLLQQEMYIKLSQLANTSDAADKNEGAGDEANPGAHLRFCRK